MNISQFKHILTQIESIEFRLPSGNSVPSHFHITEVGQVEKNFIDCGGTIRNEAFATMQLWESIDIWHRLEPKKLLSIIELSESKLGLKDLDIEIEYQQDTIGKFGLEYNGTYFTLKAKHTDCLAKDKCKIDINPLELIKTATSNCCTPGGGCC